MRVKCVLCDRIEKIDSYCLQAKRLRNRRIHTYMCPSCHDRIGENTKKRLNTGHFRFNRERKREKHLS
ncbi:YlaI family protein [Halobacillus shinanisalinarum]|uniref:YlaI family protein n=1 Tax=Halobacillus shinanisalinarum TaxID=2932258 RepID=A0ABY4GY14_9BACI|nr:YlaI family protein [Halobacillus shinanisalinarum]UOQ93043.1 YlaI family protein [Halobacillus shinanisalinarum]